MTIFWPWDSFRMALELHIIFIVVIMILHFKIVCNELCIRIKMTFYPCKQLMSEKYLEKKTGRWPIVSNTCVLLFLLSDADWYYL